MDSNLIKSVQFSPKSLTSSNAWAGHLPFAAWLINEIKPKVFVELGTYSGNSYFSFCQSVVENDLFTKCYAVDTWQGDEHGGTYTEEIFEYVKGHNREFYASFSRLLRMPFDVAVNYFTDESINLLHIDGLHTYEAVKHDFELWLPRLSLNAIVLFHDINVRENNFGVWKLWEELQGQYPLNLEFSHSHGLGVLALDSEAAKGLSWLTPDSHDQRALKEHFPTIGIRQTERFELIELKRNLLERDEKIANCIKLLTERGEKIANCNKLLTERDEQVDRISKMLDSQSRCLSDNERKLDTIVHSRSWCLTKPLRFMGRLLRGEYQPLGGGQTTLTRRGVNAFSYIIKGDFKGLFQRIRTIVDDSKKVAIQNSIQRASSDKKLWGVMATEHTLFIAQLVADHLRKHGFQVEVIREPPQDFPLDWYVVICPQMFKKLPLGEKRIVFQMEQSISLRWFTVDYLNILKGSLAVLEYSLTNIDFLANQEIVFPHVHYLPIGASINYGSTIPIQEKSCDILFYGDSKSSPRRRKLLAALQKHYKVQIISEIFGQQMQELIKQARLVINLHYYENALLELPRIQECLSLGVPVVSESTQDQSEYPELEGAVCFFEQGSITGMLEAVEKVLEHSISFEDTTSSVGRSENKFTFMFDRFLLAMGFLPVTHVDNMEVPQVILNRYIALSLPETIARRQIFEKERPHNCAVFDGLRRSPGWVGCGLSYKVLAKSALNLEMETLSVMEDDVILSDCFEEKMTIVNAYLDSRVGQWDLFSGIIASLHADVKILSVEEYRGMKFVTINKMTSMVFNIYAEKALRLMSSWDPEWLDAEKNTIDRYFESQADFRVVVVLPFLVGHREEVDSTLWGFKNTTYLDMIKKSENTLKQMVADL